MVSLAGILARPSSSRQAGVAFGADIAAIQRTETPDYQEDEQFHCKCRGLFSTRLRLYAESESVMRVVRDQTLEEEGSGKEPPRIPQRWVVILGLAIGATIALSLTVSVAVGIMAGIAIVGLLHTIMD
jgi:hypothetical protein